jgi:hypothetical protein
MGLRFPASRRIYLTRVAGTSHGAASEVTPRGPALALVRATYGMASGFCVTTDLACPPLFVLSGPYGVTVFPLRHFSLL